MATRKECLQFLLDQLSEMEQIRYRAMMGEYLLYYREKIIGYLCDDCFLVKPVPAAKRLLPQAPLVSPYPGAKEL